MEEEIDVVLIIDHKPKIVIAVVVVGVVVVVVVVLGQNCSAGRKRVVSQVS